jgi:uncharacterized protein YabE (DUF348 family)
MQQFWKKVQRSKQTHGERLRRWHAQPFGLPVTVFVGLLVISGVLLLLLSTTHTTSAFHPDTSYIAIISHDHETQTVPTHEPTVGALLNKLNIRVSPRDRVEPSLDTPIVQDNLRVNIYRAVPVTIADGTTTTTTYSAAATPRSAVAEAGLTLYAEDAVTSQPAENLVSEQSLGERIVIDRSVPLTLNDYGAVLSLRTHAKTVADLLTLKNIHLTAADTVIPTLNTPVTPGMQVFVTRKGTQIVTETQTIPAPQQSVTDPSLSFGTTAVRQQGSNGTQVLTYQVNMENGKEVSRSLLQTVITVPAVAQIVARGQAVSIPSDKQAVMAQAGIKSSDYAYVDYIVSHESGWCPTKLQGQIGVCPGYPPDAFPSGRGYGLVQATPGTKMASAGADWKTNPATQLRWASGYAVGRYGSWAAAYNHWTTSHNW